MTLPSRPARRRLAAAGGLLALLTAAGCAGGANAVDQGSGDQRFVSGRGATGVLPTDRREPAPAIRGELLDGTAYDVAALTGTVVVLNFWGSWCAPCRAEAPGLERAFMATRPSGVQFVGVNVKDERSSARAFVRTQAMSYPSLFDPSGTLAVRFRGLPPNAIPSTILLDRQGRVAARFLGGVTEGELTPVVRGLAAEPGAGQAG